MHGFIYLFIYFNRAKIAPQLQLFCVSTYKRNDEYVCLLDCENNIQSYKICKKYYTICSVRNCLKLVIISISKTT